MAQRPRVGVQRHRRRGNYVWCDPEHDLVIVTRWIDPLEIDGFVERVLSGL